MAATPDIQRVIHLPDLSFVEFCQQAYGLNRGVYNTVDGWFYQKGLTDITERRKRIIDFLQNLVHPLHNGRLKFGSGGLSVQLIDYWTK